MSDDIIREGLLSLNQAASRIPGRNGSSVSCETLRTWIRVGCRLADGAVEKLQAVKIGGCWFISEASLARFADKLTAGAAIAG